MEQTLPLLTTSWLLKQTLQQYSSYHQVIVSILNVILFSSENEKQKQSSLAASSKKMKLFLTVNKPEMSKIKTECRPVFIFAWKLS